MDPLWINQHWPLMALICFGVILYMAWKRRRERRWIEKRFANRRPRTVSFGVAYFGAATDPGPPRRCTGFLLLFDDRLFFRSRGGGVELDIPASRIVRVYHGSEHKGVELHQSLMKVDYLANRDLRETAAFRVPYPPQWIQALTRIGDLKKQEAPNRHLPGKQAPAGDDPESRKGSLPT